MASKERPHRAAVKWYLVKVPFAASRNYAVWCAEREYLIRAELNAIWAVVPLMAVKIVLTKVRKLRKVDGPGRLNSLANRYRLRPVR